MSSCISAIGIANPANKFKQQRIYRFMADASGLDENNRDRLKSIYDNSGIDYRYSVIPDFGVDTPEEHTFFAANATLEPFVTTQSRMALYQKEAVNIAEAAIRNCFARFPHNIAQQITHLITVSCTGMYAPGLDIDLVGRLGLKTTVERTCINFMGCYGAINALKTADYICRADAHAKVLVVSVELCTLHFQKENTLDNWVANSLFSDGAAAVLVEDTANRLIEGTHLKLNYFYSEFLPDARNEMGWFVGNTGFEMRLTSKVSKQIKRNIKGVTDRLLHGAEIKGLTQIDAYAIHPGGRKILEAVEEALELPEESNDFAYDVLRKHGNMSSATILFVLQRILENTVKTNQQILSFAFGPGLTVEGMVLKTHTA
ncbi:type III polyketide synthase [Mucilaginibacter boryungensis]|uniref:Type III polyketide synthase n=1 Tax=Mucilaginibacter boryungensis TaxID=768480 RepID=A0ABR9XLW8_9SPHI|nr:type III polyketide synthase [Mucilaginibacter boryungensis]MBE9668005.1 type III polyketide synthase [Mucilaginibacter boryungensis]